MELAAELAAGLLLTLASSAAIARALESLGGRLGLRAGALGSLVFPLLSSLPELVVVVVALARGSPGVAEGTVMGEPLIVSTVALPALVIAASFRRPPGLQASGRLAAQLALFAATFSVVLFPWAVRLPDHLVPAALVAAYVAYFFIAKGAGEGLEGEGGLGASASLALLVASLVGLYLGSQFMVSGVKALSARLGVSEVAVSMFLVPAATALPESVAAGVWAAEGRGELATYAIFGEMTLYSTIYPAAVMELASWSVGPRELAAFLAIEASCVAAALQARRGRITWPTAVVGLMGLLIVVLAA